MKDTDFLKEIMEAYNKSHDLYKRDGGYQIKRGMAHSISGISEDVFAVYMAEKLKNKSNKYYVDKSFSWKYDPNKRVKQFKPDLAVINKSNTLTHYYDLKTNLGWHRELKDFLISKNNFIQQLRGETVSVSWPDKTLEQYVVSSKLTYQIIVLIGHNISKEKMNDNIEIAKKLKHVKLYVLSTGVNLEEAQIDRNEFKRLLEDTKRQLLP